VPDLGYERLNFQKLLFLMNNSIGPLHKHILNHEKCNLLEPFFYPMMVTSLENVKKFKFAPIMVAVGFYYRLC
jgi:hypothetical protein